MEHWEINPSLALNLAVLDPNSFEYKYLLRIGFAQHLAHTLRYMVGAGCVLKRPLLQEEIPMVESFIRSVGGTRVTERLSNYEPGEEPLREIDKQVDHLMASMTRLAQIWHDASVSHYGRQYRKKAEVRHEHDRAEKIRKRRERQAELQQAAAPNRNQRHTKPIHAPVEMCEKCHKRPQFKSGLCTLCFNWERDKLGRE